MAEMVQSTAPRKMPAWMPLVLGVPAVIRGIDRVGDGHPLSGWLMLVSGIAMLGVAAWSWLGPARA
jgi:hypothetical protein